MKAILFDMDGVLVDSMHYHAEAWDTTLKTIGITIDKKIIYELEGANYRQVINTILNQFQRYPTEEEIQELGQKKIHAFEQIERAKPFDGITELLETLRPKYMLGVVSGSNKKTVHAIINTFFPNTFQVIIDGEVTRISKPSPEPYLIAVRCLGIPAEECLVIENAPLGIQSAKSAGLRCIAIATYLDKRYLKDADMIAEDHKDIGKCIHLAEDNEREKFGKEKKDGALPHKR